MNRRSFFKLLAASVAATALPQIAFAPVAASAPTSADILGFLGGKEHGMAVMLPGHYKDFADWACEFLIENARKYLPKGTVVEIRASTPIYYGLSQQAAWYTNPRIAVSEPNGGHPLKIDKVGGFFSAGTYRL